MSIKGCRLLKCAEDTKLFSQVVSCEDVEKFQSDLNTIHGWGLEWLMLFNADKCKCVHFGHNNRQYDSIMGDDSIETSHEEKDLSVLITDKLDETRQCVKTFNKANAMLGMINRAIKYKTKEVVVKIVKLCKSQVRPPLGLLHSGMTAIQTKYKLIRKRATQGDQDDTGLKTFGIPKTVESAKYHD